MRNMNAVPVTTSRGFDYMRPMNEKFTSPFMVARLGLQRMMMAASMNPGMQPDIDETLQAIERLETVAGNDAG